MVVKLLRVSGVPKRMVGLWSGSASSGLISGTSMTNESLVVNVTPPPGTWISGFEEPGLQVFEGTSATATPKT